MRTIITQRSGLVRLGKVALCAAFAGLFLTACHEGKDYFVYQSYSLNSDGTIQPDLRTVSIDGMTNSVSTAIALTSGPDSDTPCGLTVDGRVVFTRYSSIDGSRRIYIVNADGTGLKQLQFGAPDGDDVCVAVLADNNGLYSWTDESGNTIVEKNLIVHYLDVHSGVTLTFTRVDSPDTYAYVANLGSDNPKYLAFTPDRHFVMLDDANRLVSRGYRTDRVILASPTSVGAPGFNAVTNDNRVVFTGYATGGNSRIFGINTDGTNLAVLSDVSYPNIYCGLLGDKQTVVFTRRYGGSGRPTEIYKVGADGSGLTLIVPSSSNYYDTCQGATAGNYVVFSRTGYFAFPPSSGLYSVLADGASQPILLRSTLFSSTRYEDQYVVQAFSPVSNMLVFGNRGEQVGNIKFHLYRVDASGTGLAEIETYTPSKAALTITKFDEVIYGVPRQDSQVGVDLRLITAPSDPGHPPILLDADARIVWRPYFFVHY